MLKNATICFTEWVFFSIVSIISSAKFFVYFKRCALNQADSASSLWPPLLHGLSAEYFVVFSVPCPISSLLLLCCVLCGAFSILCCACLCSLLCAPQAELLSQHAAAALVSCQSVALLPSRLTLIFRLLPWLRCRTGGREVIGIQQLFTKVKLWLSIFSQSFREVIWTMCLTSATLGSLIGEGF